MIPSSRGARAGALAIDGHLAEQLNRLSVERRYDPIADVDYSEPFDDRWYYTTPEHVSVAGSAWWQGLDEAARRRVSRLEAAGALAAALWSENCLVAAFADVLFAEPPLGPSYRYLLHEVAEEANHNIMFVELLDRLGVGAPRLPRGYAALLRVGRRLMARTPLLLFVGVLGAEEAGDRLNRATSADPHVHPAVRRVFEVHAAEEARHIAYARRLLRERLAAAPATTRWTVRLAAPLVVAASPHQRFFAPWLPAADPGLGRDVRAARRGMRAAIRARRAAAHGSLVVFLERVGIVTPATRPLWRRFGLLAG